MTRPTTPLSRRHVIARSLSAIVTLTGAQTLAAPADAQPPLRVGVIGAGFGGLACAYELSRAGYHVDLFEARGRLGGRVFSSDRFAPNRVTEFGGELIGGNHPLWQKYAQQFGIELETLPVDDGAPEVILDGHRYSGDEAEKLSQEVERGYAELTAEAATVNWESPWETPQAEALDQLSVRERIDKLHTTDRAKRAISVEFELDLASRLEQMSCLALLCAIQAHGGEKYWTDTELYRSQSGNQSLASKLAEGVSGSVHLDCPVTRIERGADSCVFTVRDGRTFEYPDVVLAIPPSVWKGIDFVPGLPVGFAPQMGPASKFLSVVSTPFWEPDGTAELMSDTPLGYLWEGPVGSAGPERLLVSFTGGSIADDLHRRPTVERGKLLQDESEKLLPGYAAHHLKSEFINWPHDRWVQAGYSFPETGKFVSQSRIFQEGLGHLHFAGEHASPGFMGFMEGGLHSGTETAYRLMRRDGVPVPPKQLDDPEG